MTNNETINFWIENLLANCRKSSVEELTSEEIKEEIEDVKGTIENEKLWALTDQMHEENLATQEEYLKLLEELLTTN